MCCVSVKFFFWLYLVTRLQRRDVTSLARLQRRDCCVSVELPFGFISWLVYSVLLCPRLYVLYREGAVQLLNEEARFGPNLLKTAVALSSIIFFLIVVTHADTMSHSTRDAYINTIIWRVSMDILDSVTLLEVLYTQESQVFLTFSMHSFMVWIAMINLTLPTLPLVILSKTGHGITPVATLLETYYLTLYMLLVNFPNLVIRLILWHMHDQNVTVFLVKNFLSLGMAIKNIYDHVITLDCCAPDETEQDSVSGSDEDENAEPEVFDDDDATKHHHAQLDADAAEHHGFDVDAEPKLKSALKPARRRAITGPLQQRFDMPVPEDLQLEVLRRQRYGEDAPTAPVAAPAKLRLAEPPPDWVTKRIEVVDKWEKPVGGEQETSQRYVLSARP